MAQRRKQAQTQSNVSVSGMHIYLDERGRSIYYDVFSKCGYVLTNNENRYRQYSMRFILGLIGFILTLMFNLPYWLCILVGVLVYAFMEYKFRTFLKSLVKIENFKCDEKAKKTSTLKQMETNKIIIKFICLILFSILIIFNAKNEGYTGWLLYLNYAISVLSFAYALDHGKELFVRMKKQA